VTLAELLGGGEPLILLFTNPSCGPCEALLPQIAAWRRDIRSPRVVLIAEGEPDHYGATLQPDPNHPVLGEPGRRTAESYAVWGTPSALLVGVDGAIVTRAAGGADAIRGLVDWATGPVEAPGPFAIEHRHRDAGPAMPPPGLPIGQPAPTLLLNDLEGAVVDVAQVQGRPTMLLFWNPGCGFCQQMLPDLQAWDERRGPEAPEIRVISSGGTDESAAMRLRSQVLLDQGFRAGPLFGAHGTPMAVLIDETGAVASPVAAGKEAVLELAGAFA
jgi:thiol-disulfide isomerase/thioredoxin